MAGSEVPTASDPRRAATLFAALGDETRLSVLQRLSAGGPASIAQLSANSRVSRQAVSKHVGVLSAAGLVTSSREGRRRICSLAPARLDEAHEYLDRISRQWDEALFRLRDFVER